MRLAVELYETLIGTLEGDASVFDFTPDERGMDIFGVNSRVLSVAIPLTPNQRRYHAARRRNWFAELLPEGGEYDYMRSGRAASGRHPGVPCPLRARRGRRASALEPR